MPALSFHSNRRRCLHLAAVAWACVALSASADEARVIMLRDLPLLFADDGAVASCAGVKRTVWLARSCDFNTWSKPELVFAPDEQDDAWVTVPGQRTEVKNMSVFPHAAGFLGFPSISRVTVTDRPASELTHGQSSTDVSFDVQLITSTDGRKWLRTEKREPIIPLVAQGSFDVGSIFSVCSNAVHVGDETWVYYTDISSSHGAPMPPKRIAIGRAGWRRHGIVSLAAGTMEDCTPLSTDATHWTPQWRDQAAPPTDRPNWVVLQMKQARLFSLSCDRSDLP